MRKWAQSQLRPGVNLYDFCEKLEAMNRTLVQARGLERGIAFPTGASRNHVAAHWSPNPGDRNEILGENDVIKIDFGTQARAVFVYGCENLGSCVFLCAADQRPHHRLRVDICVQQTEVWPAVGGRACGNRDRSAHRSVLVMRWECVC